MSLWHQIMWGSIYLSGCLMIELVALVLCTGMINRALARFRLASSSLTVGMVLVIALIFIILAHTIQAWIWAAAYIAMGALETWNEAIYFSIVSYSTLGYGDITLSEGLRIFGSFSAVTGIIAFGLSTAYLVALLTKIMQNPIFREKDDQSSGAKSRATGAP